MRTESSNHIVDHLFRHEYGKMVATLVRNFGLENIELAEDVVQETFIKALRAWRSQIPKNPKAWLYRTAKNHTIDLLRRKKIVQNYKEHVKDQNNFIEQVETSFLDHEIQENQLRLMFAICDPSIKKADQIALGLQLSCGFSIKEIGQALLLHPETVKKRVQRAKKKLKESKALLHMPKGNALKERREIVLQILYLIFNEGFYSNSTTQKIRRDLCAEAMRLTKLLCEHRFTQTSSCAALMALMCFHASRIDSRVNDQNQIILLQDQDRSKWNTSLIEVGHFYMDQINLDEAPSIYLVEAVIAAEHCKTEAYGSVNWDLLELLYSQHYTITNNPLSLLNKAVVLMEKKEYRYAIEHLQSIELSSIHGSQHLYYAVKAEIKGRLGLIEQQIKYLEMAINLAQNQSDVALLKRKLGDCSL